MERHLKPISHLVKHYLGNFVNHSCSKHGRKHGLMPLQSNIKT